MKFFVQPQLSNTIEIYILAGSEFPEYQHYNKAIALYRFKAFGEDSNEALRILCTNIFLGLLC